ncbi:MAG: glycosyltransferase family 4 protein [Pseudomonadota bacterium]
MTFRASITDNVAIGSRRIGHSKDLRIRLRWVTWWPVDYWVKRFSRLSEHVELEVVFLASRSSLLRQTISREDMDFKYRFLSDREDSIGYYQASFAGIRWPRPYALLKDNYDVIVMPISDPTCIAASFIAGLRNTRVFFFYPNTAHEDRNRSKIKEMLKKHLLNSADGVFLTGPRQLDYLRKYRTDMAHVTCIGNPAPPLPSPVEAREAMRSRINAQVGNPGADIVLFVGRLAPEKDLHTLLRALCEFKRRRGCCPTLVLVGEGPEESALMAFGKEHGLPILFAGLKQGAELSNYYSAADLFVLPSKSEPWGLVVNEAMQFGLPVVLSEHVGSAPVLLGGNGNETGMTFPVGDAAALCGRITELLGDRERLGIMGRNCQMVIREHTIEKWCEAVLEAVSHERA